MKSDQAVLLLGAGVVLGPDGEQIGKVGQVFVDDSTSQPTWVTVKTGWFGTRESFVPLDRAILHGEQVRVPYDRSAVKGAPNHEVNGELSEADEELLHNYYDALDGVGPAAHGDPASRIEGDLPADVVVTRSEERLRLGRRTVEAGRVRLHKFVMTEDQTVTVRVSHEEARIVRQTITDANRDQLLSAAEASQLPQQLTLSEDSIVVVRETVPLERIRMGVETVANTEQLTGTVRAERIDVDVVPGTAGDSTALPAR